LSGVNDVGMSHYIHLLQVSLYKRKRLTATNNVNGLVDERHDTVTYLYASV